LSKIEDTQRDLYFNKYLKYGDDSRALSWNDKDSHFLRFCKITDLFKYEEIHESNKFSVHEIGCGLGHFKEYLDIKKYKCKYSGSDIIPEFINHCKNKFNSEEFYLQSIADNYENIANNIKGNDYYFINGTFYTKENNSVEEWELFIYKSIDNMFKMANKGICINFLTSYSDYYDDNLYYADPKKIIDYVYNKLSRFFFISHDLPLFEFYVYVYKKEFMKNQFPYYNKYFK